MKFITSKSIKIIFLFIALFFLFIYIIFLRDRSNIKIGYISSFTSDNSEAGVQGRNAAELAIEEINAIGGIKGRKLELITANCKNNPVIAKEATLEILKKNIDVLIGPLISGMAPPIVEATLNKDILLISPSVKSDSFSNLDDHFIKVNSTTNTEGRAIGRGILFRGDKKVALIWSRDNALYTKSIVSGVKEEIQGHSVETVFEMELSNNENYLEIINKLKGLDVDSLVIIARGDIVGTFSQLSNVNGFHPNLYGSEWAKTTGVIESGGRSVEGMVIFDQVGGDPLNPDLGLFKEKFRAKYFMNPDSAAILSYDSVYLFYQAVVASHGKLDYKKVKEIIVSGKQFTGLLEDYYFNEFGDVIRGSNKLYIINNSEFEIFNLPDSY